MSDWLSAYVNWDLLFADIDDNQIRFVSGLWRKPSISNIEKIGDVVYGTGAQIFEKYSRIHLKILGYNGWHEADSLLKTHTC